MARKRGKVSSVLGGDFPPGKDFPRRAISPLLSSPPVVKWQRQNRRFAESCARSLKCLIVHSSGRSIVICVSGVGRKLQGLLLCDRGLELERRAPNLRPWQSLKNERVRGEN